MLGEDPSVEGGVLKTSYRRWDGGVITDSWRCDSFHSKPKLRYSKRLSAPSCLTSKVVTPASSSPPTHEEAFICSRVLSSLPISRDQCGTTPVLPLFLSLCLQYARCRRLYLPLLVISTSCMMNACFVVSWKGPPSLLVGLSQPDSDTPNDKNEGYLIGGSSLNLSPSRFVRSVVRTFSLENFKSSNSATIEETEGFRSRGR